MSERARVALVGATGLVGRCLLDEARPIAAPDVRGIARCGTALGPEQRACVSIAPAPEWPDLLVRMQSDAVICALGTTWKKAGRNRAAFRAVDHDLVLEVARAARASGATRFVLVSSVAADPDSRNFYLRVKGEVERDLASVGFTRLDALRPGLLRGPRGGDRRVKERLSILASLLTDRLLHGRLRAYRSIPARTVAKAALVLAQREEPGRFIHEHDALMRLARGK